MKNQIKSLKSFAIILGICALGTSCKKELPEPALLAQNSQLNASETQTEKLRNDELPYTGLAQKKTTASQLQAGNNTVISGSGSEWNNPEKSIIYDNDCAYTNMRKKGMANDKSKMLVIKNFNFSIPSAATILGYEVTFLKGSHTSNCVKDFLVKLYHNGSVIGTNRKKSAYWVPMAESSVYGSSTNLWGTTLTPSQVNNSSFGVAMKCQNMDLYSEHVALIDYCTIKVFYSVGAKVIWQENKGMICDDPKISSEL